MEIGKVKRGEEEERKQGRKRTKLGEKEEQEEERYKGERTTTGLFPGFEKGEEIFFSPKSVTDRGYNEIRPPEKTIT